MVNIQEINPSTDGHGWKVVYKQGKKLHTLNFENFLEAQEFCYEFGGKNNMTVAAPRYLMFIDSDNGGWSSAKIKGLGHEVVSISFSKCFADKDSEEKFDVSLPLECGTSSFPGKKTKKGNKGNVKFKRVYQQHDILFGKTIYFENLKSFDNFLDFVINKFPKHRLPIASFKVKKNKTNDILTFQKKKVGDGTKSMELRLTHINGQPYSSYRFKDILNFADGLAETNCERIIKVRKNEKIDDICGISLGL